MENPSFEWGYNPAGTHAHGGVPFGWTPSVNQVGINDATGPFWDNGAAVDGAYVGYIQGVNANTGSVSQANSGFVVGQTYWIQFFANARQTNSISPNPTNPVLTVTETASTAGVSPVVPGIIIPYSDAQGVFINPFTFINVPFTAAATGGVLTITKSSLGGAANRSTVMLDGFSIIRRTTNDIVIANPGFEASGTNQAFPGYVTNLAGWTLVGPGAVAISQQGGVFADNGAVPDGGNVLVLQTGGVVSQELKGLTIGVTNRLTLYLNGRAYDSANGLTNQAKIMVDGNTAYQGTVAPVGGSNPYEFISFDFVASATEVTLVLQNEAIDGSSFFVDNVRVFVPAPAAPTVVVQPVGGTRYAGRTFTLAATMDGFPAPQFQWKLNGNPILGATNQTLVLTDSQLTNAGSYVLYATNSLGFTNTAAVTLSVLPVSGYAGVVLGNNPIGYWRFSDGGGTNAIDYIAGNNGVDPFGQPLQAGPQPPAFPGFESGNSAPLMNGTNQGYATSSPLLNGLGAFTLAGWFKINPAQYPFSGPGHPEGRASLFGQRLKAELAFYQGTNLYFYGEGTSTIFVTSGFAPGAWHFVAVVSNPGDNTTTVYLDGVVAGIDVACVPTAQPSLFSIGKNVGTSPENSFFPGSIDEVAVFNHALSPSAVSSLYYAGVGFRVNITPQPGYLELDWPIGNLQSATNIAGPWQNEPSAVSPWITAPAGDRKFYRAVLP